MLKLAGHMPKLAIGLGKLAIGLGSLGWGCLFGLGRDVNETTGMCRGCACVEVGP